MAGRKGAIAFETTRSAAGTFSILASDPDLILSGTQEDWPILEAELQRRQSFTPDTGFPQGIAAGWVAFDGSFRFGFYNTPSIYCHNNESWISPPPIHPPLSWTTPLPSIDFQPEISRETYIGMVNRAKEYIAAGDIYQVCLAHRFSAATDCPPFAFYEALKTLSPSPYAAYLDLEDTQLVSASPECFLRMSGSRIITRPIKGTRPRHRDPQLDEKSAYDLITSPKEIAELVMITDLERNDLGSVCEYGSVVVPQLLAHERYEQVHHLVSTVEGTLRQDISHPAALQACFPGGSISGAPKKRALEIIQELEKSPRGPYTGAIGYFGYNGESQFSMAIRTAVFTPGACSFHVGAGIVADSVAEKEWQETWDKAAGLLQAAQLSQK